MVLISNWPFIFIILYVHMPDLIGSIISCNRSLEKTIILNIHTVFVKPRRLYITPLVKQTKFNFIVYKEKIFNFEKKKYVQCIY